MKSAIVAAIERIAGDRITSQMREEIASEAIRIIEENNRTNALSAIETVKDTLISNAPNDKSK